MILPEVKANQTGSAPTITLPPTFQHDNLVRLDEQLWNRWSPHLNRPGWELMLDEDDEDSETVATVYKWELAAWRWMQEYPQPKRSHKLPHEYTEADEKTFIEDFITWADVLDVVVNSAIDRDGIDSRHIFMDRNDYEDIVPTGRWNPDTHNCEDTAVYWNASWWIHGDGGPSHNMSKRTAPLDTYRKISTYAPSWISDHMWFFVPQRPSFRYRTTGPLVTPKCC